MVPPPPPAPGKKGAAVLLYCIVWLGKCACRWAASDWNRDKLQTLFLNQFRLL